MKKSTKKSGFGSTIILILVLVIGLSLLLYPTFSNAWNQAHQVRAVGSYIEQVENLNEDEYDEIWNNAVAYNKSLALRPNFYSLTEEQAAAYYEQLNVSGVGIMGYIEIPKINVLLPIYHGTDETVLQTSVGHIDWSSLPVGGESTHCVLSGHRGLSSALLFTDLDQLVVGDTFTLTILGEVLTYEVDQIRVVEPKDTDDLLIQEGKDLVTLVTCTPYAINSHRLLVRGHRVENPEESQEVHLTSDAVVIEKLVVAPFLLVPILLVMLILLLITTRKKK